ncbi:MAG: CPBP family intramembrane metalloprotease [Candidatus Bipolaricaulota bacterium]|nr:CPBP family intramembrane metalloprotease [Candidatus Bipolaricaulota bacterium]MCS7275365.1 CPBP family intramembrane metalloprotease [Candidatus Bipolaricaulota bacterium]MDW8110136.1 CPBP family intramembrane glutamic endopeptidase [Candidatus Bipolaricaulota bacterium]MDW8329641.1 CPBP family intramembrane glutamic endopeptidase [Candidatus Bipolaricaulota bacterium]
MVLLENGELRQPQPRHAIGFLLLWLLVSALTDFLFALILRSPPPYASLSSKQFYHAISILKSALVSLWLVWIFARRMKFDLEATLSLRSTPSRSIYLWASLAVIALGVALSLVISLLLKLMPWLLPPGILSEALFELIELSRLEQAQGFLAFLLAVSVGPGISEELVFRGMVLCGLLARFRPTVAVTLTALLFGLIHVIPLQVLMASVMGLFLGYLVVRTQSIYPAIVAHMVTNFWATIETGLWWASNPSWSPQHLILGASYPWWVYGAVVIVLILALYRLHRASETNA